MIHSPEDKMLSLYPIDLPHQKWTDQEASRW